MRRVAFFILALLEIGALAYATLMTWLLSAWFLDDAVAATMSETDWYQIGLWRLVVAAFVAAFFASVVFFVNRLVMARSGLSPSRIPLRSALVAGGIILLAGVGGSVEFMITKPFM